MALLPRPLSLRSLTGRAETDRAVDVEETLDASLDDMVRRRSFGRPFPSRLASGPLEPLWATGSGVPAALGPTSLPTLPK